MEDAAETKVAGSNKLLRVPSDLSLYDLSMLANRSTLTTAREECGFSRSVRGELTIRKRNLDQMQD